VWKNLSNL